VTYQGHSVPITVNDYGPAAWTGRQLDLSEGAARSIGLIPAGVASVNIEVVN
jgi:rare lipoprotein A